MYKAFCVCAPPLILNTPPLYSLTDTPRLQAQTVDRKVFFQTVLRTPMCCCPDVVTFSSAAYPRSRTTTELKRPVMGENRSCVYWPRAVDSKNSAKYTRDY